MRHQFVTEAVVLTLGGASLGALFGLGASELFMRWAEVTPSHNYPVLAFSMLLSFILGLIAGVWPALRAAALPPIEALRYE